VAGLTGKNIVVLGASRGLGRVIVGAVHGQGARVLAVARGRTDLEKLSLAFAGTRTLSLDVSEDYAPATVFEMLHPDVLVLCGGALPCVAPLQNQSWDQFSRNWDTDVKASFQFCRAALRAPLRPGAIVVLISSGAALGGSPVSGGYAGAKRTQMFIANYAQKESDRLGLRVRFIALAPMRVMPQTDLGRAAVAGYSRYLGMTPGEFIEGMDSPQTPEDVASAIVALAKGEGPHTGGSFIVSTKGVEAVSRAAARDPGITGNSSEATGEQN
jgi:NAD(P)-dependent dehydrogenase (short-subunit alcohol dehydrogenase family)